MKITRFGYLFILLFLTAGNEAISQVTDTIANWDGINVNWTVSANSSQEVINPDQTGINPSQQCFEITTSNNAFDLIYTDFATPVNFAAFPKYHLKILAPESGGSVLLKFENSNNSSWQEIEKTPTPGEWDDLEFDFSGTMNTDFVRMVIFFDFLGTESGNLWYLDDVIRIADSTSGLSSNLPIVLVNTYGVPIPDEPKITGELKIIDNGPGAVNNQYDPPNNYDGFIGIEIRGQSALMYPKKSYGFETRNAQGENLNVSLLGMPEENDWILYAPYTDKSMLRNFISFYMGSKLDPYCSRMAFCEVIENGDYKGVYILMEKIKKDDNRVSIATLKPEDIWGDELTGGYIVKVDKIDPDFTYGIDGWESIPEPPYPGAKNIIFQYYYPEPGDLMPQQSNYIKNYIANAENALTSSFFANPDAGYNKYFNAGSFVDHMILREVAKEVDSYRYSTFFYKEKDSDGGKIFAGPPWDFNLGYANVDYWDPGVDYAGWVYNNVDPYDYGIMFWWKRMMEDPYFTNLLYTRWHQLRQNALSNESLQSAIDSVVNYIADGVERNYERWPILGQYVWPNYNWEGNDYNDEVNFFETWLFNRVEWMDNDLPGEWLYPEAALSGSYPDLELTLTDDYFCREILKNKYFDLNSAPPGLEVDTVIYENASQAMIHLKGNPATPSIVSITINKKVINSFDDLTSNDVPIGVGISQMSNPKINLYASAQSIKMFCDQPELLGDRLEIFNLSGQKLANYALHQLHLNQFGTSLKPGIYLCKFSYAGKLDVQRVVVIN